MMGGLPVRCARAIRGNTPVSPSPAMNVRRFMPPLASMSARKPRHQLDMRSMAELINRCHALDPVTAIDQDPRVANKGRCIAGHCDHDGHLAGGKLKRL